MSSREIVHVMSDIAMLSRDSRAAGTAFNAQMTKLVVENFGNTGLLNVVKQRFKFTRYAPDKFSLVIDGKLSDCRPALCSENTPVCGLSGNVCNYGRRNNVEGKLVLLPIRKTHESIMVEDLAGRGAIGAIVYQKDTPLLAARVRYKKSSIPCVSVSGIVGSRLQRRLQGRMVEAHVVVRSRLLDGVGTNIVARPKQSKSQLIFCAHRDSRIFSRGAIDNASGTALLLFLSRKKAPDFSLVSTDGEEYGLLGAKQLVESGMSDDIASEKEVINLDSIGAGPLHLVTRSRGGALSRRLNQKVRRIAFEKMGLRLGGLQTPRGSDSDVFKAAGFEACWLRSYPAPFATTVKDTVEHISPTTVGIACRLVSAIVGDRGL